MASMTGQSPKRLGEDELMLRSQLGELACVPAWIERLATEFPIPGPIQFAMNLCLEEILSNIIRHGYTNRADGPIVVRFVPCPNETWQLVVEDEAPRFNPLTVEDSSGGADLEGSQIGGLGLRLVRNFATSLRYEPTLRGNRLSLDFQGSGETK